MGGIPLVAVLSQLSGLPAVFVRKEAKSNGTRKAVEGISVDGLRVVAVEDVVTTAGALVGNGAGCEQLRRAGAIVDTAVCAIDGDQGGTAVLSEHGVGLRAAVERNAIDMALQNRRSRRNPLSMMTRTSRPSTQRGSWLRTTAESSSCYGPDVPLCALGDGWPAGFSSRSSALSSNGTSGIAVATLKDGRSGPPAVLRRASRATPLSGSVTLLDLPSSEAPCDSACLRSARSNPLQQRNRTDGRLTAAGCKARPIPSHSSF